jgi:hypothetical protein
MPESHGCHNGCAPPGYGLAGGPQRGGRTAGLPGAVGSTGSTRAARRDRHHHGDCRMEPHQRAAPPMPVTWSNPQVNAPPQRSAATAGCIWNRRPQDRRMRASTAGLILAGGSAARPCPPSGAGRPFQLDRADGNYSPVGIASGGGCIAFPRGEGRAEPRWPRRETQACSIALLPRGSYTIMRMVVVPAECPILQQMHS